MHFVAIGFVEHIVPLTEIKIVGGTTDTRCAVIELLAGWILAARERVDGQIATDLAMRPGRPSRRSRRGTCRSTPAVSTVANPVVHERIHYGGVAA